MTTGDRIKTTRISKGLTQEELGDMIGVKKAAINKYESGLVVNLKRTTIMKLADALGVSPIYLMGMDEKPGDGLIPANEPYTAPILGTIPAGYPVCAIEDIEGYASIPYRDKENYFFLRVKGDSMINAGISTGDLVLIRRQPCADDGQIVAARVNGDEATLKRYKRQGDMVFLLPENPKYEPRIVSVKDFDGGNASIIGVAIEVRKKL